MKKISLIFALFIFTTLAIGQAPKYINYQGVLRDANGNVVANKSISGSIVISGGSNYTFSIPNGSSTNSYGLFNFKIGPINGVDWSTSSVTITSTITYVDANSQLQTITNSSNPDQLVSVPYALYANEVKNYPETGTDGYYLKWDASANNSNGSWVAAPGSTLPTNATVNQVLTWDGNSWVAQANDGYEANTDNQTSFNLTMDPPTDFDNDPMTNEITLNEALNALNTKITSSSSSSIWVNSTTSGEETDVITSGQLTQVGIGNDFAREKLDVNGNMIVQNDDATSTNPSESKLSVYEPTVGLNGGSAATNTDKIELVSKSSLNSIHLINSDEGSNTHGKFEIGSKIITNIAGQKQSDFFIRQDVNYNPNPTTASYHNLFYANGLSQNIGIHSDNPGTSLSIGKPTSSTKGPIVSIGQNYGVFNSSYTYTDIPGNSLIVEGKQGLGTMYPKSKLDVAGSVRIGSNYAGSTSITTDPNNGLIVEGTVGIGTNSPNSSYKLDVNGKMQLNSAASDGGVLKIESSSQTSGDLVLINGTSGQNALKIRSGNFHIEDGGQNSSSKFSVIGSSGNTSIQGTLNTTGATSLSSTLDVAGNTSISGTLGVDSDFSVATDQFKVYNSNSIWVTKVKSILNISNDTYINHGDFTIRDYYNIDKFTVNSSTGNTSILGTLNLNSNQINNIADPTSNQDAATKYYVDQLITNGTLTAGNDIDILNNEISIEDQIDVKSINLSSNSDYSTGLSISKFNNGTGSSQTGILVSVYGSENSLVGQQMNVTSCQNCSTQDIKNLKLTTSSYGKSYGVYSINETRDHFDGTLSIGSSLKDADFLSSTGLVTERNVGIGITTNPSAKLHVDGNTKIDNGYLSVGGNTASIVRYGVMEFASEDLNANSNIGWKVDNGTEYSSSFGTISLPTSNATNLQIYAVDWDVDAYHEDETEDWSIKLIVSPSVSGSYSSFDKVCELNAEEYGKNGASGDENVSLMINNHEASVGPLGTYVNIAENDLVWIEAFDEAEGIINDYLYINSVRVKLYYRYTSTVSDGDIVANGKIYANNDKLVGDVAEYFPVNDGVEVGNIIAAEPGKSNSYKLADEPYCNHLVGVISNEPSVVLNDPKEGPPVGLTGRVSVKLVKSDLLIKSGDFITSSAQKGLGQKATHEGPVIGYAVRDQKEGDDFVEILLQPGRYFKPKQNEKPFELKTENSKEIENINTRIELLEKMILDEANKN